MCAYARMKNWGNDDHAGKAGDGDGEGATNTLHIQRTGTEVWAGERFGDGVD